MSINNVLASVAVKDLKVAMAFYEKLLGRPPDSTPQPAAVRFASRVAAVSECVTAAARKAKKCLSLSHLFSLQKGGQCDRRTRPRSRRTCSPALCESPFRGASSAVVPA